MKQALTYLIAALTCVVITATAQAQTIDWDAAEQDMARIDISQLGQPVNRSMADLDAVNLPVLLPTLELDFTARQGGEEAGVLFFPRSDTYTASCYMDDIQIEISGYASATRSLASVISIPEITLTETGQEARFSRYGAGYVVAVICSDPASDGRCSDPDFLRGILNTLRVAGGSPG